MYITILFLKAQPKKKRKKEQYNTYSVYIYTHMHVAELSSLQCRGRFLLLIFGNHALTNNVTPPYSHDLKIYTGYVYVISQFNSTFNSKTNLSNSNAKRQIIYCFNQIKLFVNIFFFKFKQFLKTFSYQYM